jgi:hypothetical protein
MRPGFPRFVGLGLLSAVLAAAAAFAATAAQAFNLSSLAAASVLIVGDVAAAFFAAGAGQPKGAASAWIRCGLVAAILSFVALAALVIPAMTTLSAGAGEGEPMRRYAIIAFTLAAGAVLIWYAHRFAWRRFAPKAGAP